jgi:hypothetical protein
MLQVGRKRVLFPIRSLDLFNLPASSYIILGLTQLLIEMNTMNLSVVKARPSRKADKLNAISDPII